MIPYTTISSGKTIKKLYQAQWGLFITPSALKKNKPAFIWSQSQDPRMRYAIDNGAWSAFINQREWESDPFVQLVKDFGEHADFVVAPDIVEGGSESLKRSLDWIPFILKHAKTVLIAVQDGMNADDLSMHINTNTGIFVGGSTQFKETTLAMWSSLCKKKNTICHIGRVNSVRRINMCLNAGATSFDGTKACRFSQSLPMLDQARKQLSLMGFFDE